MFDAQVPSLQILQQRKGPGYGCALGLSFYICLLFTPPIGVEPNIMANSNCLLPNPSLPNRYCPSNSPSCYTLNTTGATYASHKAACKAKGGDLVSWNSGEEQNDVEKGLSVSMAYYMGVEKAGNSWYLLDGTNLGNNTISNSNPYKHWRYDFTARVRTRAMHCRLCCVVTVLL